MTERIVIAGGPRTGKTTFARTLSPVFRSTDDLINSADWSAVSDIVAHKWFSAPGPWIIEGVATVRALRKWLRTCHAGRPCDRVLWFSEPRVELTNGQLVMAKGCHTIWADVKPELARRGVIVEVMR